MVHIRTEACDNRRYRIPSGYLQRTHHENCKLPKPTPPKGCERAALCFVIILLLLAGIRRDSKETVGLSVLIWTAVLCAKVLQNIHASKTLLDFLWTHNILPPWKVRHECFIISSLVVCWIYTRYAGGRSGAKHWRTSLYDLGHWRCG